MVIAQAMTGYGQVMNEFPTLWKGPVCSDSMITRLKHIGDSLNHQFRHSRPSKKYYSVEQGITNTIQLTKGDIKAALADLQQGISYQEFVTKYPLADTATNLLLTRTERETYPSCIDVYYWLQRPDEDYPTFICICGPNHCNKREYAYGVNGIKDNWVFNYHGASPGQPEALKAYYITRSPESTPIPDGYAKWIRYADYITDTTTDIFYPHAWSGDLLSYLWPTSTTGLGDKKAAFVTYFNRETNQLFKKYNLVVPRNLEWKYRDSLLKIYICDSLSWRPVFKELLSGAAEEALSDKTKTDNTFEYCVSACYSKNVALSLKRNRQVFGEDNLDYLTPLIHVRDIALLAAQTTNWPVFLRARLRVMNDRFFHVGPPNQGGSTRKLYVNEIEGLGINIPDFMLGISIYAGNAAQHHYSGSTGFLGQAFAETTCRDALGQKLLNMIMDNQLDDYNRLMMRYLFLKYVYFVPEKESRLGWLQKLEEADKTLPASIAPRAKMDKTMYEQGFIRL